MRPRQQQTRLPKAPKGTFSVGGSTESTGRSGVVSTVRMEVLHLQTGPGLLVSGPSAVWSCPQQNKGLWQGESFTSDPTARPCSKRYCEDRAMWHSSSVLASAQIKHSNNGIVMKKVPQMVTYSIHGICPMDSATAAGNIYLFMHINIFLYIGSETLKKSLGQKREPERLDPPPGLLDA